MASDDTPTGGSDRFLTCDECGCHEAGVSWANRKSCLVAECLNCGSQIVAHQAGTEMITDV